MIHIMIIGLHVCPDNQWMNEINQQWKMGLEVTSLSGYQVMWAGDYLTNFYVN